MASRTLHLTHALDRGTYRMAGRFKVGATGAVPSVGTDNTCTNGFTVSRTGVGAYTITFKDKFKASTATRTGGSVDPLVECRFEVQDVTGGGGGAAGAMVFVRLQTNSLASSQTLAIQAMNTSGAAAEIAQNNYLFISVIVRNTTTPPVGV